MINVMALRRKTAQYEFADGLRDFFHAFWLIVTGFYAWVVWDMPAWWLDFITFAREQGTLFVLFVTFILPIGIPLILSFMLLNLANEIIRRRWLWRNTGFIKPKAWIVPRSTLFTALGVAMVCFIAGILLAVETRDASLILRGLYVGIGLSFALFYGIVGVRFDLARYRWVAGIGAIMTLGLAIVPMRMGLFPVAMSALWTSLLIVSGSLGVAQTLSMQKDTSDAR